MKVKNEHIDLLIITHVDDDHIGGILKYFASNEFDSNIIKKVWFNSGKLINEHFQKNLENENLQELDEFETTYTSINQGVTFESKLESNSLWDKKLIKAGCDVFHEFGVKFTILSPDEKRLRKLLIKWETEYPSTLTSESTDYDMSFKELLLDDNFKEDSSIHNGSSIAFILEIEAKKMLFLGDSYPSVVVDNLNKLGYSKENKLTVDFVKLSHHASKANTSSELLESIDCKKFIVLTNGDYHRLPNKTTFARIYNSNKEAELYFNYPFLIKRVFEDGEIKKYTLKDAKDLVV